jgi:MOSC domain-containing protein YiiM
VHRDAGHHFSKQPAVVIELVAGHGVLGDAHFGITVQHRSRVARDPTQPNLRQVHLLHGELLAELAAAGLAVEPGQMGENITTLGLPVLALSAGTRLQLGASAVVRVTGLRNPCAQIEAFKPGLLAAVLGRTAAGELVRKAGVMAVVEQGGAVAAGDAVVVLGGAGRYVALAPV